MNTVVFSHPKESLPTSSLLPDKIDLFSQLEERGLRPVVSFNAEAAFSNNGVETHALIDESTTRHAGAIALENVGFIVNRLDRSVQTDELPSRWSEQHPPILNENALRSLVYRKQRVQDELLKPLNMGMDSILPQSIDEIDAFLGGTPASYYIAKPNTGTFSKGVVRLPRSEVLGYFKQNESLLGSTIIQPAYDFSVPFADSLKPYDSHSADQFEAWSRSNSTKELRMYGFHADGKTETFPVARAMENGVDNWFFVDPASLPEKLSQDTQAVFNRAAKLTGSRAIHGALDIGYGAYDDKDPDYHVVELNGRMPYLVGSTKHAEVAHKLRGMYADMIKDTIERGV